MNSAHDFFAVLLDRRLQRRNEQLWNHLLAWAEILDALGWSVGLKNANGAAVLSSNAVARFGDSRASLPAWGSLVSNLAADRSLLRPVEAESVQVWALPPRPVVTEPPPRLTVRETEVFEWLREGKTGPEIAIILGCAHRTVESHVARLYRKLGCHNRAQILLRPYLAP